jgi:hypothetical protein
VQDEYPWSQRLIQAQLPAHLFNRTVLVESSASGPLVLRTVATLYECPPQQAILDAVGRAVYWRNDTFVTITSGRPGGFDWWGLPVWSLVLAAIGAALLLQTYLPSTFLIDCCAGFCTATRLLRAALWPGHTLG